MHKLNYIDLFAGAGGLSEGFLRAGFSPIAKDCHYYVHPDKTQNRSISVREAARIQSYFFEGSITTAYNKIWNVALTLMAS